MQAEIDTDVAARFDNGFFAMETVFSPTSGGSRNFERGVQQVGWYIDSAPPKAVRRAAKLQNCL